MKVLFLGDSAYPISRVLMKPYVQPCNREQTNFNRKLSGIRTICTENTIGLLKQRFPCLRKGLGTKINLTCNIIVACAVLHNLSILWQEPDPVLDPDVPGETEPETDMENGGFLQGQSRAECKAAGQAHRDWLCNNFC
jgi:hypothetical protein